MKRISTLYGDSYPGLAHEYSIEPWKVVIDLERLSFTVQLNNS